MGTGSSAPVYDDGSVAALDDGSGKVVFYDGALSGNATPTATISLPHAAGDTYGGMSFDTSGNLWIAYWDGYTNYGAVVEYAAPLVDNETAAVTITGSNTGLAKPNGVSYNATTGAIVVGDYANNTVSVFDGTATGNVAPIRTITGTSTGLDHPTTVKTDANSIYVANSGSPTAGLTRYPLSASGNIAPSAWYFGPSWGARPGYISNVALQAFDFTSDGNLFTGWQGASTIYEFTYQAGYSDTAAGGNSDAAPRDVGADDQGNVYTVDGANTIRIYAPFPGGTHLSGPVTAITIPIRFFGYAIAVYSPGKQSSSQPR